MYTAEQDRERRRRRKADDDSAGPSSSGPTLDSRPPYESRDSNRRRSRRDSSTDAVAGGRKSSVRIDTDPQYPDPNKSPISPSGPSRPTAPSRPSGSRRQYPESRHDQGGDSYRDGGKDIVYAETGSSRKKKYHESTPTRRKAHYEEAGRDERVYGDPADGRQRSSVYRVPKECERTQESGASGVRRPNQEEGYFDTDQVKAAHDEHETRGSSERARDDEYKRGRKHLYPSRDDRYGAASSGPPNALALRPSRREGDSEKRTSQQMSSRKVASGSQGATYQILTEDDRLRHLTDWRNARFTFTDALSDKLRADLKTAFIKSMRDKHWGTEYKWSENDAMDAYHVGEQGRRDICAHFRDTYEETIEKIYDRYRIDPTRGWPEDVDPEIQAKVSPKMGREGLHIKSAYSIKMEGETETRDNFYLWFRSKRFSDNLKTIIDEVKNARRKG